MKRNNIIEGLPPKKGGGLPPKKGGNCQTKDAEYTSKGYIKVDVTTYRSASTSTYDKTYFYCKEDKTNHTFLKAKGAPVPPPNDDENKKQPKVGGRYQDCTGKKIRFNGCKDTDGIINRVQGCLGVKQDNLFGPKTEEQLKLKTGLEYFTTDQVDAICSGSNQAAGEAIPVRNIPWETLIDSKQIYDQGKQYKLKDNTIVYLIKYEKGTDNQIPFGEDTELNIDKDDIIALFPLREGQKKGYYGVLEYYKQNDNLIKRIVRDRNYTWEIDEPVEAIEISERKIRTILSNILTEQRLNNRPGIVAPSSSTNNLNQAQVSSGTGTTPGGSGVINTKPNPNDVKAAIEPLRLNTIEILKDIQSSTVFSLGASDGDKKTMQDAISMLQKFDSSKACEQIGLIDSNISQLDNLIKQNEGKIGTGDIVSKAKKVRSNLQKVKSECKRLENDVRTQNQVSSGTIGQTNTGVNSGESTQNNNQTNNMQANQETQNTMNQENKTVDCSTEKLIQYIVDGLQGISFDSGKIQKQREDLCYCYKTGKFNDMNARGKISDLFKEKIDDIKDTIDANVAPEKQISRKWRNKRLGWNEITKLIRGEEVFGVKLNSSYFDRNFGTDKCRATIIKESSLKNVKKLISEAVVAKRKQKTRDVIVEDILKSLRGY